MSNRVVTKRFILDQTEEQAFNTDTLILSYYTKINKGTKNILDIGTGSGVLMLDLAYKTNANIYGVEIQEERFKKALNNIKLNSLNDRLKVYNEDVKSFDNGILYDLIITNPPFFKVNHKDQLSKNKEELIARHEVSLNLYDLIKNVSRLLKYGGQFYMVHRPERLDEIIRYCEKYKIRVKEITFVHPYVNKEANHIIIKAIKNGRQGLIINKPLILYEDKNKLSKEMELIIGGF